MQEQPEELIAQLLGTVLQRAGRCRLRVAGTSMLPAIRPGDTLCVRRVDPSKIGVGDVVLFSRAGRVFAHRLVTVVPESNGGERRWTTRGDAIGRCDPPIAARQILGRVDVVRRGGAELAVPPPRARAHAMLAASIFRGRTCLGRALARARGTASARVAVPWRRPIAIARSRRV